MYGGIPINCDHDGFQAIAVCNQLSDLLGESAILNKTHLAFSLFKAVSSTNNFHFLLKRFFIKFYFKSNDTSVGRFKVNRGSNNIKEVNKVVSFNGDLELDTYDGEECNEIKGTDGLYFSPFLKRNTEVWVFSSAICRSLALTYSDKSSFHGVKLSRFKTHLDVKIK